MENRTYKFRAIASFGKHRSRETLGFDNSSSPYFIWTLDRWFADDELLDIDIFLEES